MEQSIRGQVSSTPPESEPHLKIPPILWEAIQVLPQESHPSMKLMITF